MRPREGAAVEKLIYILEGGSVPLEERRARLTEAVVAAARDAGASQIVLLIPDLTDEIGERGPARIQGEFERIAAVFECWLPRLDDRGPIEEALREGSGDAGQWGYLVTESTVQACPHTPADGERVPGVTQFAINDKPAHVDLEGFYRAWQEAHSPRTFALHPLRESYIRNAVARRLTAEAPQYLAIVYERFPSMDVFTDDARYAGDRTAIREVFRNLPSFWEPSTAIVGALSEYRFT